MADLDERLLSILATLEDCRTTLAIAGNRETAQLLAVAILDIRMKLYRIEDTELRALCDEMLPADASAGPLREAKATAGSYRRPLLKLVK